MKKVGFVIASILCSLFMMSCVLNTEEKLDKYTDTIVYDKGTQTISGNCGDKSVQVEIEVYTNVKHKKDKVVVKKTPVSVETNGDWSYILPDKLEEGEYVVFITLSKKDVGVSKYSDEITVTKK